MSLNQRGACRSWHAWWGLPLARTCLLLFVAAASTLLPQRLAMAQSGDLDAGAGNDALQLLSALTGAEKAVGFPAEVLEAISGKRDRLDPGWCWTTFLLAELRRMRGEGDEAIALHRELVLWASEDPYGDRWGACGLAVLSLWRWERALIEGRSVEPSRLLEAVDAGDRLIGRRLIEGMFTNQIFDALPQMDEAVRRLRPRLLWAAGNRRRALRLFVDYLRRAGAADLDAEEEELLREVSDADLVSRDWLQLLRGQRLLVLNRHRDARPLLEAALQSDNLDVRAEAGLSYSDVLRATEADPFRLQEEAISRVIDTAADPYLVQRAVLARGYLYKRAGQDRRMLRDFASLVANYPAGPFSDDALVEIARYHQNRGELDLAIEYFTRLQHFTGENDWADTAVYQPAIALYTRNGPGDLPRAYAMLEEYERDSLPGPVRRVALFWLGRIAEDLGRAEDAEGYFRLTLAEMPYDYYGIRARMHLRAGPGAKRLVEMGAGSRADLAGEFEASFVDDTLRGSSPYMRRLIEARASGLYSRAIAGHEEFRQAFPGRRVEEVPLADLDREHLLAPLALLMALRQDALAAKDIRGGARRRLNVAAALIDAGDLPFGINVAIGVGERYEWRAESQQNIRYLATAYPPIYEELFREAAKMHGVDAAFLYSVARQESSFDPYAVSPRGAVGLFQFMKPAFDEMDPQGRLLRSAGVTTRREYLTDPARSIELGAVWFAERKLPSVDGNLVLAVMAHHAGSTAVARWKRDWDAIGRGDDVEFMVETARSRGTRYLARRVLADYAIVRAAGFLGSE